jgi:hypothetical protein
VAETISQPGGADSASSSSGASQSEDRTKPHFEPTQAEQEVVKVWQQRVDRAEAADKAKKWRDDLARLRRYERGEQTVDEKKSRTNMIFATLAAQMPKLYARNPMIEVTPTDAVTSAEMAKVKRFGATGEKVLRKMLVEEGKLKKRAKANIRSTMVTSFGVLKVIYQKEYRGDPIAVRRIEDTQDNLARVEALAGQIEKEEDLTKLAEKRDQLRANLTALASGNEVRIFKGFTIDRIKSEDFLVLDDNIAEFEEYVEAEALGHKIWMQVGDAKVLFQSDLKGATRYGRPRSDKDQKVDDTPADEQYICVVEIWDKKNGVVRTTARGMNRWLREPYAPQHTPQRWYSFYLLGFNQTEAEWRPLSDVELLASLQEEYDRTRQNYADAREKAMPVLVFRKSGELTPEDIQKITDRKGQQTIGIEGNPSVPLEQDLKWFTGAQIDPAAYDVSIIRDDMDVLVGLSDAGRSNLVEAKTATEAEIMSEAMQSRMGERRDTHEDLLSEMGEAGLEIALRDLTLEEVKQIAGADAEWPDTPQGAEDVFRLVKVKVRAGSSGKPNQQREREQWGQLLPVIKETMQGVAELRAAGNFDMAEAMLELLRETLRRYDEHLDLDSIIPPTEKDEEGKPVAHQQAAMELIKCQEQLAQCKEELAKCQQEVVKLKAGEESKIAQAQAQERIDREKATTDASFQRWKAILDAAVKVQQTETQAAAQAHADDKAKRDEAVKAAASEERLGKIMQDLQGTLDKLGSAIEKSGKQQPQGAGA